MITEYSFNLENKLAENVSNEYKHSLLETLKSDLDNDGRNQCINIFMNLTHDFNIASATRSAGVFNCCETYFVGRRRFDRRGTVGWHNLMHIYHADYLEEVITNLTSRGYTIYPIDNWKEYDPKIIYDVNFSIKTAFLYGEECRGLQEDEIKLCNGPMIYIPMNKMARSLNVACAASVCISEYVRRFGVYGA